MELERFLTCNILEPDFDLMRLSEIASNFSLQDQPGIPGGLSHGQGFPISMPTDNFTNI